MDAVLGSLLIGTWASSLLYTAELYQAVYYYLHFKNDNWRLKMLVSVTFSIDTVAVLNDYACYTITHAGDTGYLANQNRSIPVYVFTTATVAAPVQIFLASRYWKFAQKRFITLFLSLLILAAFGGAFTCGLMVALFPAFKDRFKLKIPAILWLITEAAADVGIAAALVGEFLRRKPPSAETQNVINRLTTVTLQTGAATAAIAVAALVGYLLNEDSNIGVGFAWCLGRTYVLSMVGPFPFSSVLLLLSNLNIRKSARVLLTPPTSKAATSTTCGSSVAFAQPGTEMDTNLSGFYRHRTAVVRIESQQDSHPASITTKSSMHRPGQDIEMGPLPWRKEEEELNSSTERAADEKKTNRMTNFGH
ncbi:hypothetical protein C8R45DRAFT_1101487 [Mycena sanguinolenta]|nr:hypothetical protein C8R45DRAFT_1101487 [Mycena sanguinolenta]